MDFCMKLSGQIEKIKIQVQIHGFIWEDDMYYYLVNNKRPIKSKSPIRNTSQAQKIVHNTIVTDVKYISIFQYLYYFIKYEIYG